MGDTDLAFFKKIGTTLVCTLDDLVYEILSFTCSDKGVTATVKILLDGAETLHVDNLSMWSHKRRTEYAKACNHPTEEIIPRHLLTIQEQLQAYHAAMSKGNGTHPDGPSEMSDEEKQAAIDFLKSPDLMKKILADITLLGHV